MTEAELNQLRETVDTYAMRLRCLPDCKVYQVRRDPLSVLVTAATRDLHRLERERETESKGA